MAPWISVNATHHVVHHRSYEDQLGHRVDVLVVAAQLTHERQLGIDQVGAKVSQVEVDDGSIRVSTVRPFPARARTPGNTRSRGPSSMLRSFGSGVGLPRS